MIGKIAVALPMLAVALFGVASESEHRQHGVHVHGAGTMNVAVEHQHLMLELEAPAHDIVGFEHTPETAEEHKVLEQAVSKLRDGLALFSPNAEAECTLSKHELESAVSDSDDHDEEHHTEFKLFYQFDCLQAVHLNTLTLNIFQYFPGMKRLTVQVIGPAGQRGMKATADNAVLSLQ